MGSSWTRHVSCFDSQFWTIANQLIFDWDATPVQAKVVKTLWANPYSEATMQVEYGGEKYEFEFYNEQIRTFYEGRSVKVQYSPKLDQIRMRRPYRGERRGALARAAFSIGIGVFIFARIRRLLKKRRKLTG